MFSTTTLPAVPAAAAAFAPTDSPLTPSSSTSASSSPEPAHHLQPLQQHQRQPSQAQQHQRQLSQAQQQQQSQQQERNNRFVTRHRTAPSIFRQLLQDTTSAHRLPDRGPQAPATLLTEDSALRVIANMWAQSTWSQRNSNFLRFQEYARSINLDPLTQLDYAAVLWCESLRTTALPASRLTYSKQLTSLARQIGVPTPISRMYQAGLRSSGALIPQHQAPPIHFPQLQELQRAALAQIRAETLLRLDATQSSLHERLYTLLFIMWKSASRFDESSRVTKQHIVQMTETEIVIHWSDQTKTSRSDPFRPDLYVIIAHQPRVPPVVAATLRNLRDGEILFPKTSSWFDQWLHRTLPDSNITAHSIKAGALTLLAHAVEHNLIDIKMIPLLAKHKTNSPVLPSTTIRYLRDPLAIARVVGLEEATILLPW
jgi:hypothetical protein